MVKINDNTGWIKIHTKILNWEWYNDADTVRLFLHLMLKANQEDENIKGILVKKGSVLTTKSQLSLELNISVKKIRNSIKRLKGANTVAIKSTNKYSVIALLSYNDYQQKGKLEGKQRANKGQTKGKQKVLKTEVEKTEIFKSIENELSDNILPAFNRVFSKRLSVWKPLLNNYKYWRSHYSLKDIENSIIGIKTDSFWGDKMKLEILFRKKNRQHEEINYIQNGLDLFEEKVEKERLEKVVIPEEVITKEFLDNALDRVINKNKLTNYDN